MFSEQDLFFMKLAIEQAHTSLLHHEVPVGAVIVREGRVIGTGFNSPILHNDPTAHCEITALRAACALMKNYRLDKQTTIYVTLEPCLMCIGALLHSRIGRIVIGAKDTRENSIHKSLNLFQSHYFNHKITAEYGCQKEICEQLLQSFFKERRL